MSLPMTRLDSAIRRLQAQRSCLDWAAAAVAARPGLVFEMGLGNGRTFDHLLAPGGVLISDQPIGLPRSESLELPEEVPEGRYFIRRLHG